MKATKDKIKKWEEKKFYISKDFVKLTLLIDVQFFYFFQLWTLKNEK
jgi:hypothetical protein